MKVEGEKHYWNTLNKTRMQQLKACVVAGLGKLSCFNLCPLLSFVRCPSLCSQCTQCIYYAAGEQTVTEYFKQVLNKIKVHVIRVGEQGKHQNGITCLSILITSGLLR